MSKRIVVIGGSAAGPKAAAKARRIDEKSEVTIIQKDPDLSMASCGYPYYVGGVFDDRTMLLGPSAGAVRNPKYYKNAKNIIARTETEALSIDRAKKTVTCKNLKTGEIEDVAYDSLVLTTGAVSSMPPVPGTDLAGITTLQSMRDADYLRKVVEEKQITKAVVVGGGLIGLEACEALRLAGIDITVIEVLPQLLTFLDWELAKLVENHVRTKSVNVITSNGVAAFIGENGKLTGVKLSDGTRLPCEMAVVAVGVRPNSKLAREAGLAIGETGGILVDEYMQTSDESIFAAGDCVEIKNLLTGKKVHAPYGDLANLEGRVAGENAVLGRAVTFPGTIQTGICKVFDFAAGSTGLNERSARDNGFDVVTVIAVSGDKPAFMKGKNLFTKLVAQKSDGKILGAQCVGPGEVSKQIAQWAMVIKGGLTVEDVVNADLPYAPPFSLAIDHGIAAAHLLQNKMKGRLRGISAEEVKRKVDAGEKVFLLDSRNPGEYETMRLGIGETLIPLGVLRKRLAELPEDKDAEIINFCRISLRGYEASLILMGNGYRNVSVMEGGILAWPYSREK